MNNKLFIIGLSLALAVCINVYAKDGDKEGSLTITGIPAEYNGKFASFSHKMGQTGGSKIKANLIASSADTNKLLLSTVKGEVITNGEVKLLLFKTIPVVGLTAYTDNKTVRIELCIRDTEESSQKSTNKWVEPDFIFPSVTFKDGVAEVKLDDAFKVGYLTITGIPSVYNDSGANIRFTRPDEKKKNTTWLHNTTGIIKNGTLTVKYYRDEEDNYMPYTGMANITIAMGSPQDTHAVDMMVLGVKDVAIPLKLLFNAQMTNDNTTLKLVDGIKQ